MLQQKVRRSEVNLHLQRVRSEEQRVLRSESVHVAITMPVYASLLTFERGISFESEPAVPVHVEERFGGKLFLLMKRSHHQPAVLQRPASGAVSVPVYFQSEGRDEVGPPGRSHVHGLQTFYNFVFDKLADWIRRKKLIKLV